MVSGYIADFSQNYEVGELVFIENKEWVIAEILTGSLYFNEIV